MEYQLTIGGMKCDGCVNWINNVLSTIKGVESFNVSLEDKTLTIKVKKDKVLDEVITKIENLGFDVEK